MVPKLLHNYTLSRKSLSGLSFVCYKTTQIAGGLGGTGAAPPTSKFGTLLSRPLALSKPIYSNFQINRALGETQKPPAIPTSPVVWVVL